MATLKSDIIGRVARLPIRPSERGALLPLMEAISNSIQSVTDVFVDDTAKKGEITISVLRADDADDPHIIGFQVEDNGAGFHRDNYNSFLTPDSRHKLKKGGKGVGRLAWLKVFSKIEVTSVYKQGKKLYRREFGFQLTEDDQVPGGNEEQVSNQPPKTKIVFRNFTADFDRRCPAKSETIAHRIVSHFVPLFVSGNAPRIAVVDGEETHNVESIFADAIVDQSTSTIEIEDGGKLHTLSLWNVKCRKVARFHTGGFNFAFLAGDARSVVEYSLDEQLGLKSLDDEFIYLGCLSGEYLDKNVNPERSAFTFDSKELDAVKKAVAKGRVST